MKKYTHFADDKEKIRDFKELTKKEFLETYSYLTEEEYNLTLYELKMKPIKPKIDDTKEIKPDCSEFEEPEKVEAIIKNLGLSIGDTIRQENSYYGNSNQYTINPRMVLRGTSPEDYEKEIRLFKELCTSKMLEEMTAQIKLKKPFGNNQRYKFYNSFCKKLDTRLKVKKLIDSEAVKYFTQENAFKNCVAGLSNCVYHLLDIERELNEFKLAWFNKPIPNTQTWDEENDGEYIVLTNSEADTEAGDYLIDDPEMWKMAVESGRTEQSLNDWAKGVLNIDGRGSILNGYDGCEEYEKVNGTEYFIYRTN